MSSYKNISGEGLIGPIRAVSTPLMIVKKIRALKIKLIVLLPKIVIKLSERSSVRKTENCT